MEARRREHDRREERERRLEPVSREVPENVAEAYRPSLGFWGSVWAGVVGGFATMVLLAFLGLAIGLAAFDPTAGPGAIGTPTAIWSAIIVLLAFFVGGWLSGRMSAYHGTTLSAFLLGSMVWALSVVFIVLMASLGVAGVVNAAVGIFGAPPAGAALDVAQSTAVWSFIALALAYAACVGGAYVGTRSMVVQER